jgi:hypothetical protein
MTRTICVGAALSIAAVTLSVSASATLAAGRPSRHTLRYRIRFNDVALDLGAPGPSLGDVQVLNDTLVNHRGKVVGHDGGVCTITSLDPAEANCAITFALPGGQITTQFLNSPPPRKVAPSPAARSATAAPAANSSSKRIPTRPAPSSSATGSPGDLGPRDGELTAAECVA